MLARRAGVTLSWRREVSGARVLLSVRSGFAGLAGAVVALSVGVACAAEPAPLDIFAIAADPAASWFELPSQSPNPLTGALPSLGADRTNALNCLTRAVYYEAGAEPLAGRQAVAQVVLNRVANPLFPKSVCGVVYQGSQRVTGCQFTFTCDGSEARRPAARLWDEAEQVASAALGGFVDPDIGASTHYHAVYVSPAWRWSLVETRRIGLHIFYRMPGTEAAPSTTPIAEEREPAAPVRRASSRRTRAVRRQPATPAGPSQFSVWGLEVAQVSAKSGAVQVEAGPL